MWNQVTNCGNEGFRQEWVMRTLEEVRKASDQSILDVGAGLQPFRELAVNLGYKYVSHDFSQYQPESNDSEGLQNSSWNYPVSDLNCDILSIPNTVKYDVVICTEVLEHVPNPVAAFEKMISLLCPGGILLITVPMMSLMHQAPFWFQSGLSPQWFEYHSNKNSIGIKELTIYGDYADYMEQEMLRSFGFLNKVRGFSRLRPMIKKYIRRKLSKNVLESAGFGVAFLGQL